MFEAQAKAPTFNTRFLLAMWSDKRWLQKVFQPVAPWKARDDPSPQKQVDIYTSIVPSQRSKLPNEAADQTAKIPPTANLVFIFWHRQTPHL
ncbi:hypothetical protein O181_031268 [Austropuccinia psidii MF-1]|uniref:Uncharacterized protein n=1 Tax=Austropuccinia psidii MF-1 TaxID=1389203 RepID=A0A9Q3CX43_9BASI|nr:hypothetical protein [Austropuccinia psidii MF-1]